MRQHKIDHPDAPTSWETLGLRDGDPIEVLMVETKLVTDPEKKGYDKERLASLKAAASEYAKIQNIAVVVFHTIGDK